MSIIYLGGINGSGKTSIVQKINERLPNLHIVHGSKELMKRLNISVNDYDTLRSIPEKVKEEAVTELLHDLESKNKCQTIIVVAHYAKVVRGEITSSFGPWYGHCDKLVLITGSSREILDRITIDQASGRRTERNLFGCLHKTREQIKFLQEAQRVSMQVMEQAAKEFRIPCFALVNLKGKMDLAVEQLTSIIEEG